MSGEGFGRLLAAAGATTFEMEGQRVARNYGAPEAEYRAVREAVGMALRTDLAPIRMWGRDPRRMLHGLLTNDVLGATEGRAVYGAMLTPKGRVVADMRVVTRPGDDGLIAVVAREALPGVREHLGRYVPPMFARWEIADERWAALGLYGPDAPGVVGDLLGVDAVPEAEDDWRDASSDGDEVVVLRSHEVGGEAGFEVWTSPAAVEAHWSALRERGVAPVGHGALEALRVEAGRPRAGHELTEETIATEAYEAIGMMERAVSFTKGCYTGQEVIVRIAHRGHVNRLLRGLRLGDAPTPGAGTELVHPETGRTVGRVTSAAQSPVLGETVALAFVRREVEPGTELRIGSADGAVAAVAALPLVSPGGGP